MDLSRLSMEDLKAIADGNMAAVSDEGLKTLAIPQRPANESLFERGMAAIQGERPFLATKEEREMSKAAADEMYKNFGAGALKAPVQGTPPIAMPAAMAPSWLMKIANLLNKNTATRTVGGAIQGAVDDPQNPMRGAAIGATANLAGEGLAKVGDAAMQAAVNRSKYTPGVGTGLADEGVWGTHNMMKGQVANKLKQTGETIEDLSSYIPEGAINAEEIAGDIAATHYRPLVPKSGMPSNADMPKVEKIWEFAQDVGQRGMESGPQALSRRVAAGQRSYGGKEDPLQTMLAKLSKTEQQGYSKAMKQAFEAQHAAGNVPKSVPTIYGGKELPKTALADADKTYGFLKRAESGLDKEFTLPKSLFQAFSTGANAVPTGSLLTSTVGQAATKGGQALSNPLLRQILIDAAEEESNK